MNLNLKVCIALLVISVVFSGLIYYNFSTEDNYTDISNTKNSDIIGENNDKENDNKDNSDKKVNDKIVIHITGEVEKPGIYEVSKDSRVYEIIDLAGGFTKEAAIDEINLAQKVFDSQQIIVYSKKQINDNVTPNENAAQRELININTATTKELTTLPGIKDARALMIVNYRETNGLFTTIEDIMKVSGIKEAAFLKIKDLIKV